MRILVWHNTPPGGARRVVEAQVHGLRAAGHHVEFMVPPNGVAASGRAGLGPNVLSSPFPEEPTWGMKDSIVSAIRGHAPYCKKVAIHADEVAQHARFIHADLVLSHPSIHYRYLPAPFGSDRVPSVTYVHEPNRLVTEHQYPVGPWRPFSRVLAETILRTEAEAVGSHDLVLVNSFHTQGALLAAYGLRSTVAHPGIDSDFFTPIDSSREDFALAIGPVHETKGCRLAVDAVGHVPWNIRPRLVWVAHFVDERLRRDIVEQAMKLGVRLEIRTGVSDPDLRHLFRTASLVLAVPWLEPLGLTVLEAQACGTAVVGLAEAGLRETVRHGETGLLANRRDPADLGRLISDVLTDPSIAASLGRSGRAWIETYWTADHAASRLAACLESVV
ncbi:MAG: glycosyltransferase family 4 protein [Thermomicrobiales bacterium]